VPSSSVTGGIDPGPTGSPPGRAGQVAGSAVWISFVLAGIVAALQGTPSPSWAHGPVGRRPLEYVARGYGNGHVTG